MMIILPNTLPYGRWQPSGCHWHNTKPLAGGMPHPPSKGSIHRTSSPCLLPTEFPGHPTGKDIGSSKGTTDLCRGIQSQARCPMQSCQGAPKCMAQLMTIHGDDVMEASLLRPVEEEAGCSPIPGEEAALLSEGDWSSGAQGPALIQVEISRSVEPAEQTTTPVTSTAPHHHPSLKEKSWERIDINPNNTGQWASTYMKNDSWLPEWWEEFQPLTLSADGHCNDAKTKIKTHQQAVAFHLPTTHKKVHGSWLAPPCLAELKRKDYLRPKDPQLTEDYWEVWREETIALAIILQPCAIQVRAPPDILCGGLQELHKCLVLVVEEGNLFNMQEEMWEGVMKDPMVAATPKAPHTK